MIDPFALPALPLKDWISELVAWLNLHLGTLFMAASQIIETTDGGLRTLLRLAPPAVVIGALFSLVILRGRIGAALAVLFSLLVVWNLNAWPQAIDTVSILVIATTPAILIGLPIGILMSETAIGRRILTPLLDYMQTTPAFVYLIPSVLFFGIGTTPGVFATFVFCLPPFARAVALGLDEVPRECVEAGISVGLTPWRLILKVKLPLAAPFLIAGINQCVMLSLSMVVIASLIGARGLGTQVIESLTQMDFALGIEAGICVVALALTIERTLQSFTTGSWLWKQ